MFEIRPYELKYLDQSYDFLIDTFYISFGPDKSQWPNGLGNYELAKYRADIANILGKDGNSSFSVHCDNQFVGQIELKRLKDGCGYVSFYYLSSEYRNKGLGKQLDEFAIKELKRQGCRKVRLAVSGLNKAGQRFYEKNGWKSLGPDPDRPLGIMMEKELE